MVEKVTCLCPTYGRMESLRDVVACFILQDHPEKELIILNDAPVKINLFDPAPGTVWVLDDQVSISILNSAHQFETLGHKRQALLEMVESPVVAHWDDDDLYFPWHLSQCVEALKEYGCVRPRGAYFGVGKRSQFELRGIHHNNFEGQMVFRRERAMELGGYSKVASGQALALLQRFQKEKSSIQLECAPFWSYIYRWGGVGCHISAARGENDEEKTKRFLQNNHDFEGVLFRGFKEGSTAREWALDQVGEEFLCAARQMTDAEPRDRLSKLLEE